MKVFALLAGLALAGAAGATPPSGATIALQRTECFGPCPVYSVSVGPDLRVEFVGEENVQSPGRRTSRISRESYRRLTDAVRGVRKFRDSYASPSECAGAWASDHPGLVLTVRDPAYSKQVALNLGCQGDAVRADVDAIAKLGELIDQILQTQQWIGDPSGRRPGAGAK